VTWTRQIGLLVLSNWRTTDKIVGRVYPVPPALINTTVLSYPWDKTRQCLFCLVSTQFPIFKFSVYLRLNSCKLETGSKRDKTDTVLLPILFTPPTQTRQDKTVLSCPCRRCEQAIRIYCVMHCCRLEEELDNKTASDLNIIDSEFYSISISSEPALHSVAICRLNSTTETWEPNSL